MQYITRLQDPVLNNYYQLVLKEKQTFVHLVYNFTKQKILQKEKETFLQALLLQGFYNGRCNQSTN